jgi:hypothetical protein
MPARVCFRLPLLYLISLEHHPTRFGGRRRPILEIHHLSQNAIQSHSSFGTPLPPPFLTLFFFGLIFILIDTQCYYAPLILLHIGPLQPNLRYSRFPSPLFTDLSTNLSWFFANVVRAVCPRVHPCLTWKRAHVGTSPVMDTPQQGYI